MKIPLLVAFAALSACSCGAKDMVVVAETQLYPVREQERGYLGRYADLPLLFDYRTSRETMYEGGRCSQTDFEACQRAARAAKAGDRSAGSPGRARANSRSTSWAFASNTRRSARASDCRRTGGVRFGSKSVRGSSP